MRPLAPRLVVLLVVVAVSLVVVSTASAETDTDAAGDQVLRIGSTSKPNSLNPLVASSANALALLGLLYDPLVFQDENLRAQPALARTWSSSKNRRTWVFRIRSGQKWSDGQPVTARDAAFSLVLAKSLRDSPYARLLENVKTIERSGRSRVVITLKKPSQRAPALAVPVLPRHIWASVTRQEAAAFENRPPVGSGRFRFVENADDDLLRLTRNDSHWSEPSAIDEIEMRFFETEPALVGALERREIDLADDLSPATIERLDTVDNIATHAAETASFISLGVNTGAPSGNGNPILRDSRVRRAIAHAVDRDALRRGAIGDNGVTGTTIVPPISPFHAEPTTDAVLEHDPIKAAKLLDQAGVRDDDGDGVRTFRSGAEATLRLYTRSALPETGVLGMLIAAALGELGIAVERDALTDRELQRRINGGRYDLFIWGWASEPDPDFILSVLSCGEIGGRGLSDTYFCDPPYERVYQKQRTTRTASTRKRLVQELQLRAYRESPYLVLYYRPNLQAYRTDRYTVQEPEFGMLALSTDPAAAIVLEPVPGAPDPEQVAPTGLPSEEVAATGSTDSIPDERREPRSWIVIGVFAVVLVTAAWLLARRLGRRRPQVMPNMSETDLELFEIDELEGDPDDDNR